MKVLILGGGLAGLSTAVHLAKNKIPSTIIEASPKLGGRAFSFDVPEHRDVVDNGQHILMGCYNHTFDYLKTTGALDKLDFQDKLGVVFVDDNGIQFRLRAKSQLYPINLVYAILNYDAIGIFERLKIVKFFIKLFFSDERKLRNLNVREWLEREGQTESNIKNLWEILAVGTMNSSLQQTSAKTFARVLKEIFFNGNKASTIVLPKTGLSQLFCEDAENFVIKNGGSIQYSERVQSVKIENGKIIAVITNKSSYTDFDYVISSLPPYALKRLDGADKILQGDFPEFNYSTIMSIHIWLSENPFKEKFYGLIDSPIHWLFNHQKYISLTVSNANEFNQLTKQETINIAFSELEKHFPFFYRSSIQDFKIIKEKRATFVPDSQTESIRENITSNLENLKLAGDWTDTKLPATIEGAIKSGATTVKKIFNN